MKKIINKFKKLYRIIRKPEMEILPGHLAFFLVLSIIPIILLLVIMAAQFSISLDVTVNFITENFPKDVADILVPFFKNNNLEFGLNEFIVASIGLFIASNGIYSVIVSANALYKEEGSNAFKRRIKSIILTIFLLLLFVFMVIVLAFGDVIMLVVKNNADFDWIYSYINYIYLLIKWPFAIIYIFIIINLIYTITPDSKIKSRTNFLGSVFTTVTWILVTLLYSYYVANFSSYNLIYGSLSSIVVMMIWIYLLSFLFIVGLAINASKYVELESTNEVHNEENN